MTKQEIFEKLKTTGLKVTQAPNNITIVSLELSRYNIKHIESILPKDIEYEIKASNIQLAVYVVIKMVE